MSVSRGRIGSTIGTVVAIGLLSVVLFGGCLVGCSLLGFLSPARGEEAVAPESAEETIRRFEAEVRALRSTVAALVRENKALKAEMAASRAENAEIGPAPAKAPAATPTAVQPIAFEKQEDFKIGAVGRFPYRVRIERILSDDRAIVSMNIQVGERTEAVETVSAWDRGITRLPTRTVAEIERWSFLLRGFATAGLVDGVVRNHEGVFVVTGTEEVDGRRIFALKPYTPVPPAAPAAAP